jgi:hypothetical protein
MPAAEILGGQLAGIRIEPVTLMFYDPESRTLLRTRPNLSEMFRTSVVGSQSGKAERQAKAGAKQAAEQPSWDTRRDPEAGQVEQQRRSPIHRVAFQLTVLAGATKPVSLGT